MSEVRQQTQGGHRGVKIQASGEANGGQQREEFTLRDFKNIEHVCSNSQ